MAKAAISGDKKKYGTRKVIVREVTAYPFDEWLAKAQTILMRKIDFAIDPVKMAQQIRNEASERGLSVSIKVRDHAISLTVWDHIKK